MGIAEAILVWIFSARVKEGRRERWERGARMGRGSAALGVKGGDGVDEANGGRTLEATPLVEAGEMEGTDGDDDSARESQAAFEVEEGVGSVTDTSAMEGGAGRGIRLRRRAIGSTT